VSDHLIHLCTPVDDLVHVTACGLNPVYVHNLTTNPDAVTCTPCLDSTEQTQHVDPVNHPPHYTSHPSGVECIQVVEHMNFSLGNAVKYIWRADEKGNALEDLEKARWYLDRELQRRAAL
jgi:hypothetical protein